MTQAVEQVGPAISGFSSKQRHPQFIMLSVSVISKMTLQCVMRRGNVKLLLIKTLRPSSVFRQNLAESCLDCLNKARLFVESLVLFASPELALMAALAFQNAIAPALLRFVGFRNGCFDLRFSTSP